MVRQRPLGTFDNAQALTAEHGAYNIVTVVRLTERVDEDRLRQALRRLVERHAMLRSRVVSRPRRTFELADVSTIPLEIEAREEDNAWAGVVERELATGFDVANAPLARCIFLTSSRRPQSEILLTFPHLLADGTAVTQLVGELLEILAGSTLPSELSDTETLPPNPDDIFPAPWRLPRRLGASLGFLWRQMKTEVNYRRRWRGRNHGPPAGPYRCRILPRSFTLEETAQLVRSARGHRVTLASALEAAMLLAVVRHRYGKQRLPHHFMTFPLLRRHLDPPLPETVVGCYIAAVRLTTSVSSDDDLWTLAETVNQETSQAMRRGERFLASIWSYFSMRIMLRQKSVRMCTSAVSYTGPTPSTSAVESHNVEELHAFVSNLPIGAEYSGQARLFRGRLWLDLLYLDSDMSADEAVAIGDTMRDLLLKGDDQTSQLENEE